VPLRSTDRRVIGALLAGAADARWLTPSRRKVLLGIAEQCGVALERARLQAAGEVAAADARFLAGLAKSLERSTAVRSRAERLTHLLTEERATFAAVHLTGDGLPRLLASSGSRPDELGDDERWRQDVELALATGRPVAPVEGEGFGVVPLRARGRSIGALTYRAAAGRREPTVSPALADEIATRAAVQLDNALLYEQERDASHALQLGLLGGGPPTFDGVVVSATYRPGTAALEVGGDWYDAFPLPSGSTAVVVGDVVGHGLDAAVAMGQLRGAVGALAQWTEPARLLEQLDAFVENVPAAATATLAFAELAADGRLRYACAGHPPPLVVAPDGATRFLWDGRSAPLGSVLGTQRSDAVDRLAEGETLVLYTDGLVERRAETFDVGLARLAAAARLEWSAGPGLADDIGNALLLGSAQEDDVCVLTLHRVSGAPLFSRSFLASPAELAPLRRSLRAWLGRIRLGAEATHGAILAVSEAAANAVEHGYESDGIGIVTVMARLDDGLLRVSIRDEGRWRERRARDGRGRGLRIIEAIVDDVTIDRSNGATVVRMSSVGPAQGPG
jgi:serine/threonine-protein kinase RsbW